MSDTTDSLASLLVAIATADRNADRGIADSIAEVRRLVDAIEAGDALDARQLSAEVARLEHYLTESRLVSRMLTKLGR